MRFIINGYRAAVPILVQSSKRQNYRLGVYPGQKNSFNAYFRCQTHFPGCFYALYAPSCQPPSFQRWPISQFTWLMNVAPSSKCQNYQRDAYSCLEIIPSRSFHVGENSPTALTGHALCRVHHRDFEHAPFRISISGAISDRISKLSTRCLFLPRNRSIP